MAQNKKFSLVAAACLNNGIGIKGRLPWTLRNEMAFFTRVTSTVTTDEKKNAVIMGRKTWDSIPLKFKPLPNRVNVVLSESLKEVPKRAHYLFDSLSKSVEYLSKCDDIDHIYIIGGQRVYEEAIDSDLCDKVYLTRVFADFECDAFFPNVDPNTYKSVILDDVPQGEQEENGLKYQFFVYQRQ